MALDGAVIGCEAFDVDHSGTVDVTELIEAVRHALEGCPS
jgi:hypothetical protein